MIASRYVVVSSVRGTRNAQRRLGSRGSLGIILYEGRAVFLPPGPPGEMTGTGAARPLTDIQLPGTPYALPSESHVGCILSLHFLHFLIRRTCNPRIPLCPCLTVGSPFAIAAQSNPSPPKDHVQASAHPSTLTMGCLPSPQILDDR